MKRIVSVILLVLLVLGFATVRAAPTQAPPHISAGAALQREVAAAAPGRNLYSLANQLVLRPPRSIPHVIRHINPNYAVGHQDRFFVLSEDQNKFITLRATIRAKTPHLYIYVQNGVKIADSDIQRAATRFEQKTYPTDRAAFGSEWSPGVDGDPHIICLVGDLKSSRPAGYFSAEDEYPHLVNPYSNQREMFYINAANTLPGGSAFDLTLSHEFQHMIHWNMHPRESLWINEGMSMLAEQLNGFSAEGEASAFLSQPKTQLDAWDENNDFPHYGAAYLFLSYVHERFGTRFTRAMLADKQYTDLQLVDDVLQRLHIKSSARKLFAQWVVANYVADKSVAGGVYGYKYLSHAVDTPAPRSLPFTYKGTIPPYTADYTTIDHLQTAKPFTLHFSAPATIPVVGVTRAAPFWWSNRGDMMQTSLERTVDLRSVQHVTLHFDAWWEIEKNYDYAYVEVSKDGGKTYSTLKTADTTTDNPNAASYGNGFTAFSNGWKKETVDLSRFAGQQIKLRFQYITDDGMNYQSMLIQHLAIPEIGWKDNFTGWTAKGFLPLFSNALPSDWSVQLVSYTTSGVRVSTLPLTAAKKGSITIDPTNSGLKKLVVVVFTTAPKTTVNTAYTLSAKS